MIRPRRSNVPLPWRVYERFGKRTWRIYFQPVAGTRVHRERCIPGDRTKAEARAKARLAYQRLYGSTPEAIHEALTCRKLGERYFEWQESLPADDEERKADSMLEEN